MTFAIDFSSIPEDDPALPLLRAVEPHFAAIAALIEAEKWDMEPNHQLGICEFLGRLASAAVMSRLADPNLLMAAVTGARDGAMAVIDAHTKVAGGGKSGTAEVLFKGDGEAEILRHPSDKKH